MVSTGGVYGQALQKHFFDPFAKETGTRVTSVAAGNGEQWVKIKAMTDAKNVGWDMFLTSSADVFDRERQKMTVSLGDSCEKTPKAKSDGFDDTCHPYGVLAVYGVTLLVNNKSLMKGPTPQNWADFWNVKDYPGPRALGNFGDPWRVLIGALLADGVPRDKLFPLDMARAFKKLDEIKPQIALWWRTGDQIQRAFREGEVASGLIWSTRAEVLQREGIALERVWDGATLNLTRWSIVRGAPNAENAIRFINWFLDHPEHQMAFCREMACAPATKSATALLPEAERRDLPTAPGNRRKIVDLDLVWIADNNAMILTRWNEWLARSQ